MSPCRLLLALFTAAPAGLAAAQDAPHDFRIYAPPVDMVTADAALGRDATALPPLPEGVEQLAFREIFRLPIGPRGLEFTEKARSLEGRRTRMLGFMVREDRPVPGRLLLSPYPFTLFTGEYGHAEDLPPTIVHVHLIDEPGRIVAFTPGLLLLTGTLETGPREEADGRVSAIRLHVAMPTSRDTDLRSSTHNLPTEP